MLWKKFLPSITIAKRKINRRTATLFSRGNIRPRSRQNLVKNNVLNLKNPKPQIYKLFSHGLLILSSPASTHTQGTLHWMSKKRSAMNVLQTHSTRPEAETSTIPCKLQWSRNLSRSGWLGVDVRMRLLHFYMSQETRTFLSVNHVEISSSSVKHKSPTQGKLFLWL